jgi:hypothetical protein
MQRKKPFFLIITLFVILSFSIIYLVGASSTMWTQTYGGASNEYAFSLVETYDGGYIIGGSTEPMFAGSSDCWLVKTDANGNMLWNQTFGGEGYDNLFSLVETSDGGYALACTTQSFGVGNNDFWLVKTDMNGNTEWNQTYGGAESDITYSLIETSDGGYAISGYTNSFGDGSYDSWLIKTDVNGNMLWNKTYGGAGAEEASSLVETSDGGYALAGLITDILWLVKTDVNGNMLWNQTYGRAGYDSWTSLVQTFDGGYVIAGTTDEFDFWLIKTDANGNMLWNHTYGGTEIDGAYSLVETYDGGFALAGVTTSFGLGNSDCWLIKTDANGNMLWNHTYGGTEIDGAYSLVETYDGGFALAGTTTSYGHGFNNFWLVRTNEYGIPEFPSWLILPLLLVGTLVSLLIKKKIHTKSYST